MVQLAYGCFHFTCIPEECICSGLVMAHSFEISNVVTNAADICLRQFRIKFNHSNLVFLVYDL